MSTADAEIEVLVGRVGKPHGLRGEVTLDVRTDEPELRFAVGAALRAVPPSGSASRLSTLTVSTTRWHQGVLLVRFEELPDRTAAESARGTVLHATLAADAAPADPEEFYAHQLVGLAAYDVSGTLLGEVTALATGAAQDLLTVRTPDGRDALVPFVSALVPEVDVAGGRIVIADRPGLVSPFPDDDRGRRVVRLDYLTIFPDYLAPLSLSLTGKAIEQGLVEVHVHDLRRVGPRPAPDRGRLAVRRRRRHGHEARPVGRGLRRDRPRRRDAGRPDARGAAVHPGAGPRPVHPRPAGLRLRALRGDRPAGRRPRGHAGRGRRGLARRLRPQRRRGGRAGGDRGGGAPAARLHEQPGLARRGVARGRAAREPGLHAAGVLARPGRPRRAARRRPRGDHRVAVPTRRCGVRRSAGRTSCTPAGRGSGRSCPPPAPTPASC